MGRIGCARALGFALGVARLGELPQGPLALVGPEGRVRAADPEARAAGVAVGQRARLAQQRCPALLCRPWSLADLEAAQARLADGLAEVAPGISPVEDQLGAFWFDARGLRWLGGEPGIGARLQAAAAAAGFPALRVGFADTATAALAAALMGGAGICAVPPGADAAWLADLPLEAPEGLPHPLGLPPELAELLAELGLRTVGALAALPAGEVLARLGPAGQAAWARARGVDPRLPLAEAPPAPFAVRLALEAPVRALEALGFALRRALERLCHQLIVAGQGARSLVLELALDGGARHLERLILSQPGRDPRALLALLQERLGRQRLVAPALELALSAPEHEPLREVQPSLALGAPSAWDADAIEAALDRLRARFGAPVVFCAVAQDAHRPEASAAWVPVSAHAERLEPTGAPPLWGPVRRLVDPPRSLELRCDAAGRPQALRQGGRWRAVQAFGPERLSGDWWAGPAAYACEDWRLALPDGAVLWVRRDAAGWWLYGRWD